MLIASDALPRSPMGIRKLSEMVPAPDASDLLFELPLDVKYSPLPGEAAWDNNVATYTQNYRISRFDLVSIGFDIAVCCLITEQGNHHRIL